MVYVETGPSAARSPDSVDCHFHPIRSAANRERVRGGLATTEGAKFTVGGFPETGSSTGSCLYDCLQDDASAGIVQPLPTSRRFTVLVALSELGHAFLTQHLQVPKFFFEEVPLYFCPSVLQLRVDV